jgi:hypothetical protein
MKRKTEKSHENLLEEKVAEERAKTENRAVQETRPEKDNFVLKKLNSL